jgi:hypothetical protein
LELVPMMEISKKRMEGVVDPETQNTGEARHYNWANSWPKRHEGAGNRIFFLLSFLSALAHATFNDPQPMRHESNQAKPRELDRFFLVRHLAKSKIKIAPLDRTLRFTRPVREWGRFFPARHWAKQNCSGVGVGIASGRRLGLSPTAQATNYYRSLSAEKRREVALLCCECSARMVAVAVALYLYCTNMDVTPTLIIILTLYLALVISTGATTGPV